MVGLIGKSWQVHPTMEPNEVVSRNCSCGKVELYGSLSGSWRVELDAVGGETDQGG